MTGSNRRRAAVLRALAAGSGSVTWDELARRLELPRTTVRFHLESLVGQGVAERAASAPTGRGRPAVAYRLTQAGRGSADGGRHSLLVALTRALDETGGVAEVRAAGRRAGAARVSARRGVAAAQALVTVLAAEGFEPEPAPGEVYLNSCPYLSLARDHSRIICGYHAGLVEGFWEHARGPGSVSLEPFGGPRLCRITFSGTEPGPGPSGAPLPGAGRGTSRR